MSKNRLLPALGILVAVLVLCGVLFIGLTAQNGHGVLLPTGSPTAAPTPYYQARATMTLLSDTVTAQEARANLLWLNLPVVVLDSRTLGIIGASVTVDGAAAARDELRGMVRAVLAPMLMMATPTRDTLARVTH